MQRKLNKIIIDLNVFLWKWQSFRYIYALKWAQLLHNIYVSNSELVGSVRTVFLKCIDNISFLKINYLWNIAKHILYMKIAN